MQTLRRAVSKYLSIFLGLWDDLKKCMYLPVSLIPGSIGWQIRRQILGKSITLGRNVKIDEFVRVDKPNRLQIGDETFIGRGTFIHAGGGVQIGANVLIGPYVKIWSADHCFADRSKPINEQGHEFAPIVIDDDVWLGVDCIILKGVTIGRGAVVGAGSVVTKDIPPYAVVVGVPAQVIGSR